MFIALLRGINVGGNNVIKMERLRELFVAAGFVDVSTYIQSGNIIFRDAPDASPDGRRERLVKKITELLFDELKTNVSLALLSSGEMKAVVSKKPPGFGEEKDIYKYDVIFLIKPLKAKDAIGKILLREGVDRLYEGDSVIYIRRLISEITKSRISKIAESPVYPHITIRNWNTTNRLASL